MRYAALCQIQSKGIVVMRYVLTLGVVFALVSGSAVARDLAAGDVRLIGDLDLRFNDATTKVDNDGDIESARSNVEIAALYYLSSKIALGGAYEREMEKATQNGSSAKETFSYMGAALLFTNSLSESVNFDVVGQIGFLNYESKTNGVSSEADGFGWSASVVLSYFLTHNVSFDIDATYSQVKLENSATDISVKSTGYGVGAGLSVYF